MASTTITDDFDRLGSAIRKAAFPAIGLALLSAGILGAIMSMPPLAHSGWGGFLFAGSFIWFHGIFITTIAWKQIKTTQSVFSAVWRPGLIAGALLAIPLLGFSLLDAKSASYSCADGAPYGLSSLPNLPWLWIGWACVALTALPARAIGVVIGEQPPLIPFWRRGVLALPFMPFLWFFGHFFEWRTVDCSRPLECCGLFEGGLVILPLLGFFLFVASFSLAVLSAANVDQLTSKNDCGDEAARLPL